MLRSRGGRDEADRCRRRGTFTGLILVDEESGRITVDQVPSTPDAPARAVIFGVGQLCARGGVKLGEVDNPMHGTTIAISSSGFLEEKGEYWVYLEVEEGSSGGRYDQDGLESTDCLIANTRNNPIEELEWRYPMRTERYELRDKPCAAGKWRGGDQTGSSSTRSSL